MMLVEFCFFCNNLLDALRKFRHNGIYEIKNTDIIANEHYRFAVI